MPDPILVAESVSLRFGSGRLACQALDRVSTSFGAGSLTLVIGPSGSGKTTLLSVLGALLRPDSGTVRLAGEDLTRLSESRRAAVRHQKIGFIFQSFRLLHSLSALDNAAIGAEIRGLAFRGDSRRRAKDLLATLGLEGRLHLKPDQLSGGEKQRVAIARALLADPVVVLADEPTAALDSDSARQVGFILRGLAHVDGKTVVVVSHDARWQALADQVIHLTDGRVVSQSSEVFSCA